MNRFFWGAFLLYSSIAIGQEGTSPSMLVQIIINWFPLIILVGFYVILLYIARHIFRAWHEERVEVFKKIERHLATISKIDVNTNNSMANHTENDDEWKKS